MESTITLKLEQVAKSLEDLRKLAKCDGLTHAEIMGAVWMIEVNIWRIIRQIRDCQAQKPVDDEIPF